MTQSSHLDTKQLLPLPQLGVLAIDGADAANFLQGYLTSDTAIIGSHALQATAFCNLQGRVVANGYATASPQGIWLVMDRSSVPLVIEFLKKYLLFAKSKTYDLSDAIQVYSAPPDFPDALPYAENTAFLLSEGARSEGARSEGARSEGARSGGARSGGAGLSAPAGPDVMDTWRFQEILAFRLLLPAELSGEFLPQMLGLDKTGAVSFDKGCYLGQEIVARAQHRGELKRQLIQLHWQGPAPRVGDKLLCDDGTKAGIVVSIARAQESQGVALAVVSKQFQGPFRADSPPDTDDSEKILASKPENSTWFRQAS